MALRAQRFAVALLLVVVAVLVVGPATAAEAVPSAAVALVLAACACAVAALSLLLAAPPSPAGAGPDAAAHKFVALPAASSHRHGGRLRRAGAVRPTLPRRVTAVPAANRLAAATGAAAAADSANMRPESFDEVVQGTYTRYPMTFDRGSGCTLYDDAAGRQYLDFVAGIATCSLGHANARLLDAVTSQMSQVHHVSNLYYTTPQGRLAQWLVDNSPGDKAFFCNSGGEANEAAIKLAIKHAVQRGVARPVILTAHGSFHGRTIATISATGQSKYHGPDECWRVPDLFEYVTYNDAADLARAFDAAKAAGRGVAAVMMEALQGEGGVVPGDPAFFAEARRLCDATGALLVCDEVQVGMGRTGRLWGFEGVGVVPDVFTVAKGIGGGIPLGAMVCQAKCDVLGPGDHGTTYGGNPLACAAGLAVAAAVDEEALVSNAAERGAQLRAGLEALAADRPGVVQEVRGWGLILGMVLAEDGPKAADVVSKCAEQGLLVVPAGPKVVRFVPPLVVSAAEVDAALAAVTKAVHAF